MCRNEQKCTKTSKLENAAVKVLVTGRRFVL